MRSLSTRPQHGKVTIAFFKSSVGTLLDVDEYSDNLLRMQKVYQGPDAFGYEHDNNVQSSIQSTDDERRRSSVYRSHTSTLSQLGGHQSFFQQAPAPAGVPRDQRPLKDRSYQAKIGQELLEYLAQHNFEMEMKHTLSQNIIKSPT